MATNAPKLYQLKNDMISRIFPVLFDDLVPRSSHLLNTTLSDYLPKQEGVKPYTDPRMPPISYFLAILPPAHHLVYFPPSMADSMTLPDGTDPNQSPGKPFTRRMWAGGELHFHNDDALHIDGSRIACVERIADVLIKGHPGSEKLFVRMERAIGKCREGESDDAIRKRFGSGDGVAITEIRNIFFSRPLSGSSEKGPRPIKSEYTAGFSHAFVPNAKLLFRYSALTFNTHAIHRDIDFCRNIEHYPGLIVHGPLSLTFLTTFLRHHLAKQFSGRNLAIKTVKYRNTHPLYNEQQIKLCIKQTDENEYELWEENPEGNVAVQYSATTEVVPKGQTLHFQDEAEYNLVQIA